MDSRPPFPDGKLDSATLTGPDMQAYGIGVITFTMGLGVGLAILACIVFNFCLLVNCCRRPNSACGCCRPKDYHGPHEKCCGKECCPPKTGTHYLGPDQLYNQPGQAVFAEGGEPQNYQVKNTRVLFFGLFFFFIAHVIFTGITYQFGNVADKGTVDLIDGTVDLLSGFANLVCSDVDPLTNGCEDDSIGGFLGDVVDETNDAFDTAVDTIDSIADVANAVGYYQGNITATKTAAVAAENSNGGALTLIPGLWSAYDTAYAALSTAATGVTFGSASLASGFASSDIYPGDDTGNSATALTFITTDDTKLGGTVTFLDAAYTAAGSVKSNLDTLTSSGGYLYDIKNDIDTGGSTRDDIVNGINDLISSAETAADSIVTLHTSVDPISGEVSPYLTLKTQALAVFTVIPAIMLLYHSLGEAFCGCRGCRECCFKGVGGCLRCHNCAIYFGSFIYCIVAGIMMLFSCIIYDVCENFEPIITNNIAGNLTVLDASFGTSGAILDILHCDGDNIVDILQLGDNFNFTTDVSSVMDNVYDAATDILQAMTDATSSLSAVTSALTEVDSIVAGTDDVGSTFNDKSYLDDLFANTVLNLPTDSSSNSPNAYTLAYTSSSPSQLYNVAKYLAVYNTASMYTDLATKAGGTISRPTYTAADNLCTGTYCVHCTADTSCSMVEKATASFPLRYLKYTSSSNTLDFSTTTAFKAAIDQNNDILDKLDDLDTAADAYWVKMQLVQDVKDGVDDLNDSSQDISDSVDNCHDLVVGSASGSIKAAVDSVLDQIALAPDYTSCQFIGDWYRDTFEGSFCTDVNGGMQNFFAGLLLNALLLIVSFLWIACWTPYMRLSRTPNVAPSDDGKDAPPPLNYMVGAAPLASPVVLTAPVALELAPISRPGNSEYAV